MGSLVRIGRTFVEGVKFQNWVLEEEVAQILHNKLAVFGWGVRKKFSFVGSKFPFPPPSPHHLWYAALLFNPDMKIKGVKSFWQSCLTSCMQAKLRTLLTSLRATWAFTQEVRVNSSGSADSELFLEDDFMLRFLAKDFECDAADVEADSRLLPWMATIL